MFSPPALQSPAEFQQRLRLAKEADQLVLVLCFAPWCAACKALHPKLQQLAERNTTVTFLEVGTAAPIGALCMLSCSARSALAGGSAASSTLVATAQSSLHDELFDWRWGKPSVQIVLPLGPATRVTN